MKLTNFLSSWFNLLILSPQVIIQLMLTIVPVIFRKLFSEYIFNLYVINMTAFIQKFGVTKVPAVFSILEFVE